MQKNNLSSFDFKEMKLNNFISDENFYKLKESKNLLAFSGGVDSSALFFILLSQNIPFDLAIVNYNTRLQSKQEEEYAKYLSSYFHKKCHVLESSSITNNFESSARKIRYDFFHSIIFKYKYNNLILAHHLNDKLEWLLMQLSKGCGLNTLLGFNEFETRTINNKMFNIIRPLISTPKNDLKIFNDKYGIKYFIDESNFSLNINRNFFRHQISNLIIDKYSCGIKRSFKYLENDFNLLYKRKIMCVEQNLFYFKATLNDIHEIDLKLKELGYVISSSQRNTIVEILERNHECIIGSNFVIAKRNKIIYIGIYPNFHIKIPKAFKNKYRCESIPPKIRKIMYSNYIKES